MTKKIIYSLALVLISMFNAAHSQQTAKKIDGIGYLEYLPPTYNNNPTEKFPVLIFLHGLGERGDGSSADLFNKVGKWGPPKHIKNGNTMCFNVNGTQQCFIVISPQLPSSMGSWSPGYVDKVVDYVLNSGRYKVDKSKVYLTGLSLGGGGTWSYAYSSYNSPNQFAAIAPVAAYGSTSKGCTISERKISVWAFHGDADGTVAYLKGLNMFNAVKNCTDPTPTAALKFTTYPGINHNSWTNAYTTDNSLHNPNLYQWLLQKSLKTSAPVEVPPVANAGSDLNIQLPVSSVTINGSGKATNSVITDYSWQKVSGPSATLKNVNAPTLSVENPVSGTYKFRLTVTDGNALKDTDEVLVTVQEEPIVESPAPTGGSWLEVTAKAAAGKDLVLFYNSKKSTAEQFPVASSGNNNLTFKLKTISGNPDWSNMEAQVTAYYQREAVVIENYITNIGTDWTTVTIPLSDFGFDAWRLKNGVSDFRLKMRYGFGASVFGLDEIKFTGGTNEFVWYGDSYTTSGASESVVEQPEFYISARMEAASAPTPPPTEKTSGSWLEVTAKAAAGKDLVLFYNNKKSTAEQFPVTSSGNNNLTFKLKTISGNPDWSNMEAQVTAYYQREAVVIENYITNIGTDWTTVTIPLSDFGFDAWRLKNGVSDFRLKMRYGFGASIFGLDEIKFTGGTNEFIWYGDSYTTSGAIESVVECSEFFISDRKDAAIPPPVTEASKSTGGWLEVTAKAAAGKEVVMFYNQRKSAKEVFPVTASGNDQLTFKLKTISGNPDWSSMDVQVTAYYQRQGVVIQDYITKIGSEWTTVTIPLSDFGFDASRLQNGVSDVRLKMRYGFGASVFGLDEIKFTGGTEHFTWYGDSYTTSGSEEAVYDAPEFYISDRVGTASANRTAATGMEDILIPGEEKEEKHLQKVVDIYDMQGHKINNTISTGTTKAEIMQELHLKSGMYIIRVNSSLPELKSFKALVR